MTDQKRAAAGGEYGANGEWYPGGAFIATTDHPKVAPIERRPIDHTRDAERKAAAERVAAWLDQRRQDFADIIATLTANPGDVDAARWQFALENGHAGFLPSLGRQLYTSGSLSRRQADYVARAILGRPSKRNADAFDALIDRLTENAHLKE